MEEKKSSVAHPRTLSKGKMKTTYSTQTDSMQSPKANASEYFIQNKLQRKNDKV